VLPDAENIGGISRVKNLKHFIPGAKSIRQIFASHKRKCGVDSTEAFFDHKLWSCGVTSAGQGLVRGRSRVPSLSPKARDCLKAKLRVPRSSIFSQLFSSVNLYQMRGMLSLKMSTWHGFSH